MDDALDEIKISDWNEGMFQMRRIDKIENTLNSCWINPTAFNNEFNVFNYEVIFSCVNSMLQEIRGKLTKGEKEKAEVLKRGILIALNSFPIYKQIKKNGERNLKFQIYNWKVIMNWLYKYESMMRELANTHGFSSPEKSDSAWF